MSNSPLFKILGSLLLISLGATQAAAQETASTGLGETTFKRVCAACHVSLLATAGLPPADPANRAPPRERLRQFSAEAVLAALTTGKMRVQGAALTEAERHAVAQYASGSQFGVSSYGSPNAAKANPCPANASLAASATRPSWNGWSPDPGNTRFQSRNEAGLAAADLPKLKLKWAFGYPNVSALRAQPTVFGGRVFAATDTGELFALDAKSGCTYWTYKASTAVATAPTVGRYSNNGHAGYAVYVGDRNATLYAVDADSGALLWSRKVDEHRVAGITGAPTLYRGRLFVAVQGVGEENTGASGGYPCCTFRGSVSALDADTGAVIWKTYTMPQAEPRLKTAAGVQLFGPAGGSIWASPTIDVRRSLVYVGTGNGYADPPQPTTDAILALDLKSGAIRWVKQLTTADTWAMGCRPTNQDNPACPPTLGADFDLSASPILAHGGHRDLLIAVQKSGVVFALDPGQRGALLWQYRFGRGSGLGGQWGGAIDHKNFYIGTADLLSPDPGGMHAVDLATGMTVWEKSPPPALCSKDSGQACGTGQGGPLSAIPGAVLNAGLDGGLRAYAVGDGSLLWIYDTNRDFATVNGIKARGGAMDHSGPVVADGMLYVNSGNGGLIGHPGNVLLAFGLD